MSAKLAAAVELARPVGLSPSSHATGPRRRCGPHATHRVACGARTWPAGDAAARRAGAQPGELARGGEKGEKMTLMFRVQVLPGGLQEVMTSKGTMSDESLVAMD